MKKNFSEIWSPSTLRLQAGIAGWHILAAGMVGGAGALMLSAGLVSLVGLIAAGAGAAVVQTVFTKLANHQSAADSHRLEMRSAPKDLRIIGENLMLKAGLSPRYKLEMGILARFDEPEAALNAVIYPLPTGPDKDLIVVGVGADLVTRLTKEEMTAVVAHELGHIVNRTPLLSPVYGTIQKGGMALLGLSVLTFNPVTVALAMGTMIGARICCNRAMQLDEERADRTSYNLFPDDKALPGALKKIDKALRARQYGGPDENSLLYSFMKAATPLLAQHPELEKRKNFAAHYVERAATLHEKHDIPKEPGAYAAQFNQAAQGNIAPRALVTPVAFRPPLAPMM